MSDSVFMGSVVVGGEVAAGGVELACLVELPVVPDAGGEGQHALADACPDAFGDVTAVVFERELALGGVVDRLDPLADGAERLTVSREAPHGTGVESNNRSRSQNDGETRARWLMTA